MSGKSSPEVKWTDDEIQLLLKAAQNLKVEEDYKKIRRFYSRPCKLRSDAFTFSCFVL